jgi:hypothetical protein
MKYFLLSAFLLFFSGWLLGQQDLSNSLHFDGVNDYVAFRNTVGDFGAVPNFQGEFTFEAWIKNDNTATWGRVFDFNDSTNDYILFTPNNGVNGNSLFEYRFGGTVKHRLFGPAFPNNVWTHLAVTLDNAGNARMYFDGVEVANTSGWPSINGIYGVFNAYLGKSAFSADPYFRGNLQEVRVWKEARTAQEIMDWKDCQLSGREANLTAYLKMNEGIAGQLNTTGGNFIQNFGVHSYFSPQLYNFNLNGPTSNWVIDSGLPVVPANNNVVEFHRGK